MSVRLMRRRKRDESGATAVEFALILIPLLVVLFGLVQYGLYFYSAQTGSNTANATVRQLAVGNCQDINVLRLYVNNSLGPAKTANATVTPVYTNPDGSAATASTVLIGGTVKLTISFPTINLNFPFVPYLSDSKVTRVVQARVEDTTELAGACVS
jgi:Flp pilus assembly protein TadG